MKILNSLKPYLILISTTMFLLQGCQDQSKAQPSQDKVYPKVSVQLWSVRDTLKEDFKGTLTQIANMGFDGVEFAREFGPYANDPKGLRVFLNELGLKVSAAHTSYEELNDDNFAKSVDFYQTIGASTLIIGWDERAWDSEQVDAVVTDLIRFQKKLAPFGIKFGYHNHDKEFNAYKGVTFWDYIAQSSPAEIVMQIDAGWVIHANKNPVDYINRYPGQTEAIHIKAMYPTKLESDDPKPPYIGKDVANWTSIIDACIKQGGTKWFVIEQEEYPEGVRPINAVKQSKQGFDRIYAQYKTSH